MKVMSIRDKIIKRFMDYGSLISSVFCEREGIKKNHLRSEINKLRQKGFAIDRFKDEDGNNGYYLITPDKVEIELKERDFTIIQPNEEIPKFKLFTKNNNFYFISMGDVHLDCKEKKQALMKDLEKCRENDIKVFLNGDIFEMATRYSVGAGVYAQVWNNEKQSKEILDVVLKYRDIIIMILEGNHERRAYKEIGISPLKQIAEIAQIPFVAGRSYVDICTPVTTRKITVTHDIGSSAQTARGKIHAVYKKVRPAKYCHFYLGAHLHDGLSDSDLFHTEENEDGLIYRVREFAVMNPSYIKYFNSYGDHKGYEFGTGIWRYCFIEDENYGLKDFKFEKYIY